MKWSNIIATAGFFLTVALLCAGVIGSYAISQYQIAELRDSVKTLQDDVKIIREQRAEDREAMVEVRNDVRWIREAIEKMTVKP